MNTKDLLNEDQQTGSRKSKRMNLHRRLSIILMLGGLLICGVLFYRYYWHNHEMGIGPTVPEVDASLFAQVWSDRPVLLLGLGDSITDGFGASPGKSYFKRLIKNPENEFPDMKGISLMKVLPGLETSNHAMSGTTSIELVEYSLPRIDIHPEEVFGIVVLTTGGNDIIHDYGRSAPKEGAMYGATLEQAEPWIENFESRLADILDIIESKFPGGCEIFLANIYDPTDGVGDTLNAGLPYWKDGLEVLERYNQIIEQTCSERKFVHLIDIHSTFLGHGIHCKKFWKSTYRGDDPFYWYFDNLEDPNDRGYDSIRRLYLNKISEIVPERLKSSGSVLLKENQEAINE